MNMQEMATAVCQDAPVIVCILNNFILAWFASSSSFSTENVILQPACVSIRNVRATVRDREKTARYMNRIL